MAKLKPEPTELQTVQQILKGLGKISLHGSWSDKRSLFRVHWPFPYLFQWLLRSEFSQEFLLGKVTSNPLGSSCSNTHCQWAKSSWESRMRPVLKPKPCDDTFKPVKIPLPQAPAHTQQPLPFLLTVNPRRTQSLNPTSSAAALNSRVRRVTTFCPHSGTLNPACKECLNIHLPFRKINYPPLHWCTFLPTWTLSSSASHRNRAR